MMEKESKLYLKYDILILIQKLQLNIYFYRLAALMFIKICQCLLDSRICLIAKMFLSKIHIGFRPGAALSIQRIVPTRLFIAYLDSSW